MPDTDALLTVLRYACVALGIVAVAGMALRVQLWRRGRPADVAPGAGFAALPTRYFRDVHDVVTRDPRAARMHMLAAGGFAAAGVLFVVDVALGRPSALRWPGLLAAAAMAVGAALAVLRRFSPADFETARRSAGEWRRFVAMMAVLALGFAAWFAAPRDTLSASPLLVVAAAAILAGGLEIGVGMIAGGPIRHVFAGAANLAMHPRPARFSSTKPDAALRRVDLSDARLGLATVEDIAWNRVLNLDACVQCGRCEALCPAFDAGQPLNPKALVHDLARASGLGGAMGVYAGSPHPGLAQREGAARAAIVPDYVAVETLWSCTTCRACVSACPMMIEHVDFIIDLRRHETLEKGALPGASATVLTHLKESANQGGRPAAARFLWASDFGLRVLEPGGSAELLWIVGEAGYSERNRRTLRAFAALLRHAGVDVAVLGDAEVDSGDLARRLGEEALFVSLAERLAATLAARSFGRIVTTDPHVMNALRNEYPEFGARHDVLHHTELLAELLESGRLRPARALDQAIAFHDPCYLGRHNGQFDAPRRLLAAIAPKRLEMARSGLTARCCGGGGGAPLADIPGRRRIPDQRIDDARASGAAVVAVACPNCALMLEGVTGDRPEIADIAELLADCMAWDARQAP